MTAHIKVPDETICEIVQRWDDMTAGEHARIVREAAQEHGVKIGTIYNRIKGYRECGRRTAEKRSDKGRPRLFSKDKMKAFVKAVMGIKAHDPYKPDGRVSNPNKVMSTERAIEILEKMGQLPEGKLTARTVNRWAKIYDATVKKICAAKPAVKLVSEHPNHVHLVDFSVCEQYYLREKDGKIAMRPWTYKNKPNESREKIWTFALVDHYSTAKYIRYFLSAGESSRILYHGLMEAWEKRDDTQFPFHGAPRILYADKGSALRSERIQNMLEALGVKVIYHKPGNPRAKGMVESAFKHLQVDFETELRHCPALTLEDLNDRVYNWLIEHNWKSSEGEDISRFAKWQEISGEQLLELPPKHILARVTASHQIRTVDAYCTVSIQGEKFGVPEDIIGKKVRVWFNIDGGISVQDIETGEMYRNVEPKKAVFGEFRAHKKSDAERMQDDAIRMAKDISKAMTPYVLRRDIPNLHGLPKTGKPIEVDSELVQEEYEEYGSIYQAKMAIADELRINLGDLEPWLLEEIESALNETLDKEKVHKIAQFIEGYLREARDAV